VQRVTKHGKEAVVVIPAEEYERLCSRKPRRRESLIDLLRRSPLVGAGSDLTRPVNYGRDVDL
jgi:hypothetical protein